MADDDAYDIEHFLRCGLVYVLYVALLRGSSSTL